MSFLSVDELKTFKKMTGGDSLFAEFKGQDVYKRQDQALSLPMPGASYVLRKYQP